MRGYSFVIITVSDRCYRGEAKDESGSLLIQFMRESFKESKYSQLTLPDEQEQIEEALINFSDEEKVQCILTTGGTGFAPRDVTPEATRNVITKECPQFSQVMLLEGLKMTPFAALSRAVCGVRNETLIVNLPGSTKAVGECFAAIKALIPHAIDLICDEKVKSEEMHAEIQKKDKKSSVVREPKKDLNVVDNPLESLLRLQGIDFDAKKASSTPKPMIPHASTASEDIIDETFKSPAMTELLVDEDLTGLSSSKTLIIEDRPARHSCPHKTANPADQSDRNSPFPMIEVDDALKQIFSNVPCLAKPKQYVSPINCPPFRASIKDGYAMKSVSTSMNRKVIGFDAVNAGDGIIKYNFADNECYKINTGAPIPDFADSVVQVEDTKLIESHEDGSEAEIQLAKLPKKDFDIRQIGSDIKMKELLFTSKGLMDVAEKTLLASVGLQASQNTPKIAIISTGDELVDPTGDIREGQIYDSNTTMLKLLCEKYGFEVKMTQIAGDDYESLKTIVYEAIAVCDVIVSSGGVSMGDKDFVKKLLVDLGFEIHFGRVNMKPGKPMTFASNKASGTSYFALPGNPVSAFVTFHIFVLPALRFMVGFPEVKCSLPTIKVYLQDDTFELDERPEFARATIILDKKNGKLLAKITSNQISSRIASLINADVLVHLPRAALSGNNIKGGFELKASVIDQFFISAISD